MAFGHGCAATLKIGATNLEGNLENAYWLTAEKFGDIFELHELINALKVAG